jgi:hypothetical protein
LYGNPHFGGRAVDKNLFINMIPTGYLGNLNPAQYNALHQLWGCLLTVIDHGVEKRESCDEPFSPRSFNSDSSTTPTLPGSKRLHRRPSRVSTDSRRTSIHLSNSQYRNLGLGSSEIKQLQKIMMIVTPDEIREGLLNGLKIDHPDALLLRFLRAKKWDVGKAFILFLDSIVLRTKVWHVDDEILLRGELYAIKQIRSSDPRKRRLGSEYIRPFRNGKSFIHGVDRAGRPIVTTRVRYHIPSEQSAKMTCQYILQSIETSRLLLKHPLETTTLVFDLTGFSLANMDFSQVKFIIQCVQDIYPGSIGLILIHNAPKIFAALWRIIKGWMNADLVSKTHFTMNVNDLERFISRDQIPKELGGNENWEYRYVEPSLNEDEKLHDFSTRSTILADRLALAEQFQDATMTWLWTSSLRDWIGTAAATCRRDELIEKLRLNYWRLDPYIRARTQLDRTGVIVSDGGGPAHFYPSSQKPEPTALPAPPLAVHYVCPDPPNPVDEQAEEDVELSYFDDDDESELAIEVFETVQMPAVQMIDRSNVRLITV